MEQLRDPERLFAGKAEPAQGDELLRLARAARIALEPPEPGAGIEEACDLFCALAALGRLEASGSFASSSPLTSVVVAAGKERQAFADELRRRLERSADLLGPLAGAALAALRADPALAARARGLLGPDAAGPRFLRAAREEGCLGAPDAPGFAYQHFRAADRERLAGSRDRVALPELPLFTQTYTERAFVDFLVENTLGRLHLEGGPSPLVEKLRHFVPPTRPPSGRAGEPPTVLDPACGGGAFLLGAMDLLVAMRLEREEGSAREAGEAALEAQLFGLDVDPRAVAVARFSLLARLLELGGRQNERLPEPRLAVASGAAERARFAARGALPAGLDAALAELEGLGSLFDPRRAAKSLEAIPKGGALDLLGRRYDVVLMNPPFAGFRKLPRALTERLAKACPLAGMDLCGAFLERALAWLSPSGLLGAVAPASWMTSSRTERLRSAIFERQPLLSVGLGQRAFDEAPLLFASLFVASGSARPPAGEAEPLRVLRAPAPGSPGRLEARRWAAARSWPLEILEALPGLPLLPAAPPALLEATRDLGRLGEVATARDGFWGPGSSEALRHFWEIGAREPEAVPVSGGKGYRRWFAADRLRAPRPLVLALRGEPRAEATWEYSRVAGGKLSARLASPGSFAIAGVVSLSPREGRGAASMALVGALMNARLGTALLRTSASGLNFNPGYCRRLPLPALSAKRLAALSARVDEAVLAARAEDAEDPSSGAFDPRTVRGLGTLGAAALARRRARLDASARALEAEAEIEAILAEALGLSGADLDAIEADLGLLPGRLPRGEEGRGKPEVGPPGEGSVLLPPASPLEALCRSARLHPRKARARLEAEPPTRDEIAALVGVELCRMLGFRWPTELELEPRKGERKGKALEPPFALLETEEARADAPAASLGARLSLRLAALLAPEAPAREAADRLAAEARRALGRSLDAWAKRGFEAWLARAFLRRPPVARLASRRLAAGARARHDAPALEVLVLLRRFDPRAARALAAEVERLAGSSESARRAELLAYGRALEAFARSPDPATSGFACDGRLRLAALRKAGLLAEAAPRPASPARSAAAEAPGRRRGRAAGDRSQPPEEGKKARRTARRRP